MRYLTPIATILAYFAGRGRLASTPDPNPSLTAQGSSGTLTSVPPSERGKEVSKFVQCRPLRRGLADPRSDSSPQRCAGKVTSGSDAGVLAQCRCPASFDPTAGREPYSVRSAPRGKRCGKSVEAARPYKDPNADLHFSPDARCQPRGTWLLFLLGGTVARVTSLFAPCAPLFASFCAPSPSFLTSFCASRASFLTPLRTRLRRLSGRRGGRGAGLGSSR
jgi:hypothetical protein